MTPTAPSGSSASTPTLTEQEKVDAARALLLASDIMFSLFDFSQGQFVTHAIASVMNEVARNGVPILIANLSGALAQVSYFVSTLDGTFAISEGAELHVDRTWLSGATTEELAAVLAHESWHVHQLYSGIMDDFVNHPREVDIEYEAFVAGAAVWNAKKGSQTEPNLDAGSACVASGEARCKETLHTDFGYKIGLRRFGEMKGVS